MDTRIPTEATLYGTSRFTTKPTQEFQQAEMTVYDPSHDVVKVSPTKALAVSALATAFTLVGYAAYSALKPKR